MPRRRLPEKCVRLPEKCVSRFFVITPLITPWRSHSASVFSRRPRAGPRSHRGLAGRSRAPASGPSPSAATVRLHRRPTLILRSPRKLTSTATLTRLSRPSTRTSSLASQTHIEGFSDDATLLGLENPTLLDVRGIEGPGEVGENPSPQGAVNATWDTLNMGFVDPAKLPADKNAPVVVF